MRRLRKFTALPAAERSLLVRAAVTLIVMRLGLSVLSFRRMRRVARRAAVGSARHAVDPRQTRDRVRWAIETAARYVPGATCLPQALAAQLILRREGLPGELMIGVAKRDGGRLRAHAWLESGGAVVVGGRGLGALTPLTGRRK